MEVTVEFEFNGVRVEVEGYRPSHEDEGADITSAHVINDAGRSEQLICPCCGSDRTYKTEAIHCNRCAVTTEI